MVFDKMILWSLDNGNHIEFMFNPSEISFQGAVDTSESTGARSQETGAPKVSFSNIKAYTATLKNVMFDTYEEGTDVVAKYISKFRDAVKFVPGLQRPPVFEFRWGTQRYMTRCFIEKFDYRLTMFLPNGTPVRAVIDTLTLKEVEEPKNGGSSGFKTDSSTMAPAIGIISNII